nr:acyl-CoA thioesterase [Desulfobulbaceae bacterium]
MVDKTTADALVHSCQTRVLYGDTDSGGVVYYGNYLRYFEKGRTEFMRAQGISYKSLEESGFIMPVVENYTRYKASATYDDLIEIQTTLAEVKQVSCKFIYQIRNVETNRILVKGHTVNAIVDKSGRLTKFPDEIYSKLIEIARKLD